MFHLGALLSRSLFSCVLLSTVVLKTNYITLNYIYVASLPIVYLYSVIVACLHVFFLILCFLMIAMEFSMNKVEYNHCRWQSVSRCSHSSVEKSSIARHCCPLSPSSAVVLYHISSHFLVPLSDSSLICTESVQWLVILDTIIAFTFFLKICACLFRCVYTHRHLLTKRSRLCLGQTDSSAHTHSKPMERIRIWFLAIMRYI